MNCASNTRALLDAMRNFGARFAAECYSGEDAELTYRVDLGSN